MCRGYIELLHNSNPMYSKTFINKQTKSNASKYNFIAASFPLFNNITLQ